MHQPRVELPESIKTERLVLRPFRPGDGDAYFVLCMNNKEHLPPFEAGNPALSAETEEDAENLVAELAAAWAARDAFPIGVCLRTADRWLLRSRSAW